ncbi:hypothetical protein [Actinoplanes couchii]|uniref:hypothetical protein n=1 Tax=Actinoplanes couchii TaxID=403638 RepID=UPI0031D9D979
MRDRELRQALAENPALPVWLVERLIAEADDDLALCLAERDDLDSAQVRTLAGRSDEVATVLARRGLLNADDVDPVTRPYAAMVLIEEGRGRDEWAVAFARDPDVKRRVTLAACPQLPDEANLLLVAGDDAEVVTELAFFTTDSDLLTRLAGHPDADVRAAVASNPATPPTTLANLVTAHWRGKEVPPTDLVTTHWRGEEAPPTGLMATDRRGEEVPPPSLAPPSLAPPSLAPPSLAPPSLAPPSLPPPSLAPPTLTPTGLLAADRRGDGAGPVVHRGVEDAPPDRCSVCVRKPVPFVHSPNCPDVDCGLPPDAACDGTHQSAIHNLLVKAVDNSATPVENVVALAAHPSPIVRWTLAGRADLPAAVAEMLAADPWPAVRAAVAANPALSEAAIRRLGADEFSKVRWRAARNPSVPIDVLAGPGRIGGGDPVPSRIGGGDLVPPRIAAAGPDEVRELADSPSPQLRMLLAERRDLPPEIRDRLARDPDAKVVKAVAPHPGFSEELLRDMVSRHGARVIARVAANPDASPGLLFDLARHLPPVRKVFREIAGRADATADALELCLADAQARRIAAAHPALRPELIVELLADDEDWVATAAAANPALPESEMIRISDRGL